MSQPEGPLRAARLARGWSQSRAVSELTALAADRGVPVAAPASLKTQLSRWENQHALPDEHYRALLRELYADTGIDLGLTAGDPTGSGTERGANVLRTALRAARMVDDDALALLRGQIDTSRAIDSRLGAVPVVAAARSQLLYLEQLLAHTTSSARRRDVAGLVVDAAALNGRLARDQARQADAWLDYETARSAARDAESPTLMSYALAEQASLLLDADEPEPAIEMIEEASTTLPDTPSSPVTAWLQAKLGVALAASGASAEARSAFRRSERRLAECNPSVDIGFGVPFLRFDHGSLLRHRGHGLRLLQDQQAAIDDLEHALRDVDVSTRETAQIHVDLAIAHGAAGNSTTAAEHARSARDISTRIGSVRLAAELDAPTRAHSDVVTRS